MLRIFLIIAVIVATCERSFSKLKLIKSYLRSSMSTLRIAIEESANKKARKVTV